jgi:Rps23 Pro-64 3,4-dihydroxylase Tpa1-like proline 4-hydroxylase
MTTENLAARLNDVLELEYAALMNGEIAAIAQLSADKLEILEEMSEFEDYEYTVLEQFRVMLIRNQLLTNSAIEGMRSAIQRARDVQSVASGLQTYTAGGQNSLVALSKGQTLSKRS